MDNIKNLFNKLKEYFQNNPNIIERINNIESEFENKEYDVSVVANMSAGKSMFINALIGEEILPSFNEATSDVPVFITPSEEIEAIVEFEDKKDKIVLNADNLIELKKYAKKDSKELEEKYKNVKFISLKYPFKNLKLNEVEINIIDTPGPNNTGEFKEKHKKFTKQILRKTNAVLFLFDYTQLDANLDSDEQGLWHSIKERVRYDKNFKVIFILNKIDFALEDNAKLEENDESLKKYWFIKEKEAVTKLVNAAKNHNIENPIVLPVSSKLSLIMRKSKKERTEKKFLNNIKDDLEYVFEEDNIEDKLIEYSGIENLEKYLNKFINTDVIEVINNQTYNYLISIIEEEKNRLNREIELSSKPYKKTYKKIEETKKMLNELIPELEKELEKNLEENKNLSLKNIENILKDKINEIFDDKKITGQIVYFFKRRTKNDNYQSSKKIAFNASNIEIGEKEIKALIKSRALKDEIARDLEKFQKELFNLLIENFNDSALSLIKRKSNDLQSNVYDLFVKNIIEIEKEINKKLNINKQIVNIGFPNKIITKVDIKSNEILHFKQEKQRKVKYKKEYYVEIGSIKLFEKSSKPITTTKTINSLVLNINDIKKQISVIKDNMQLEINSLINDINNDFNKLINNYLENLNKIKNNKKDELTKLQHDLNNRSSIIEQAKENLKKLEKIKKG